eukprot:2144812-Prorocentrum_lima.AAC.1
MDEGTYFVGQGHYIVEVLETLSSSMHYKTPNTPGEPESFSNNKKHKVTLSRHKSNITDEMG